MKYCPWCGEELPAGVLYCPHCGKQLPVLEEPVSAGVGRRRQPEEPAPLPRQEPARPAAGAPAREAEPARAYRPPAPGYDQEPVEVQYRELPPEEVEGLFGAAGGSGEPADTAPAAPARSAARRPWPLVALAVLVVLLITGLAVWMSVRNSPSRMVEELVGAIRTGDTATMARLMDGGAGLHLRDEDINRFAQELRGEKTLLRLQSHLLAMGDTDAAGYQEELDCFALVRVQGFSLHNPYRVVVYPMWAEVTTNLPQLTLSVDGQPTVQMSDLQGEEPVLEPLAGYAADEYMLVGAAPGYQPVTVPLAPGTRLLSAVCDQYGVPYSLGEREIHSYCATRPVPVNYGGNQAAMVIELAGSEQHLEVLVDDMPTDLVPAGGRLTISPVFAGMKITLRCDEYDETFTAGTAPVQNIETKYLQLVEQRNPDLVSLAPGDLSDRQLAGHLVDRFAEFYLSYLQAINAWDPEKITGVDERYTDELVAKMEAHNQAYLFRLNALDLDKDSLQRFAGEEGAVVRFAVKVDYDYSYRHTDPNLWYAGGNYQQVSMSYNEQYNQWEILKTQVYEELPLSENLLHRDYPKS